MDEIKTFVEQQLANKPIDTGFIAGVTPIGIADAQLGREEVEALVRASLDLRIVDGKITHTFELELARFLGVRYATTCNSGSSANLLAFMALTSPKLGSRAIQREDEVIVCAVGFPTTISPIINYGAIPVFVDVSLVTYNPTAKMIAEAITDKTKAIFFAHTLGNPFDLDSIKEIAEQNELWLIEDNCDAFGSEYNNKKTGTIGDISTTSFYPAHMMTTGEGGAVFTNNSMLNQIVRSLRDWGRECFPSGTLINTQEKQIPIENIKVGDIVLSHTGENRYVTEIMSRDYSGELFTIKPHNGVEISCTELHPFYVKRNGNFDWIYARDLKKTDLLVESLPKVQRGSEQNSIGYTKTAYKEELVSFPITDGLLRLIGYWLAEGSLASGKKGKSGYKDNSYLFHRVDFSFNKNEVSYIEDVCTLMKEIFGVTGTLRISKYGNQQGASITFKSRKAFEFFGQFFGRGANNKSIPQWVLSLPLDFTKNLIIGYWRGDGSSSKIGYSFCSVSSHLLNQVRRLLGMNGIMSSYCLRTKESHNSSIVNNREVIAKHDAYWLNIYGESAKLLSELLGEDEYKLGAKKNRSFTDLEYIYYPISSIKSKKVSHFEVYNLEVGVDHSYHANNLAVHNCWCLPNRDNTCGKRFLQKGHGELPDCYDHKYVYSHAGYNLKSTDLQSSVGLEQLKKLPNFIERRRHNWQYLRDTLVGCNLDDYFLMPEATPKSNPAWFGFILTIKKDMPFTRKELLDFLAEKKIATRNLFGGNLTRQPAFVGKGRIADELTSTLPKADIVMTNTFWLGVHPGITDDMLDYVVDCLVDFTDNYK